MSELKPGSDAKLYMSQTYFKSRLIQIIYTNWTDSDVLIKFQSKLNSKAHFGQTAYKICYNKYALGLGHVLVPSTDVIQLTLTLRMTTAQVVETSVTVNNNSPIQDYIHSDDHTQVSFIKHLSKMDT